MRRGPWCNLPFATSPGFSLIPLLGTKHTGDRYVNATSRRPVTEPGQHLGPEPGNVLLGACRVPGGLDEQQVVPDRGARDGAGERPDAVLGATDRMQLAQQFGVGVRVTRGVRRPVGSPVAGEPGTQPAG